MVQWIRGLAAQADQQYSGPSVHLKGSPINTSITSALWWYRDWGCLGFASHWPRFSSVRDNVSKKWAETNQNS